ncbi:hypothetical protein J5J83_10305 [Azoarcus sp. L1K30]|uniref:hypothetical protein n=1 Tax=Azoarcus sp. L1K30 TaxID=2820277 RepID=UPI001B830A44|nr:hypothetical protein [Azoarcus sp. L1K30]MBR0566507.1 hypothetical protein [Azoarcus sp. L1K30]
MTSKPSHRRRVLPISAWLLGVPGLACLIAGLTLLLGDFSELHPLLAESGTAIALIVSAIALLGSAAFPVALRRLANADTPAPDQ